MFVRCLFTRLGCERSLRAIALFGLAVVGIGIGMAGAALAKEPGQVHCYRDVCHRVKSIGETERLVGTTSTIITSHYDDARVDRFNTGRYTSSGEEFNANAPTRAASANFPDGTELLVWNPDNGRAAHIRINDFGPFHTNRKLDVTRAVAEVLGFERRGVVPLRVTIIAAPPRFEPRYMKAREYAKVEGYLGVVSEEDLQKEALRLTTRALFAHSAPADDRERRKQDAFAASVPLPVARRTFERAASKRGLVRAQSSRTERAPLQIAMRLGGDLPASRSDFAKRSAFAGRNDQAAVPWPQRSSESLRRAVASLSPGSTWAVRKAHVLDPPITLLRPLAPTRELKPVSLRIVLVDVHALTPRALLGETELRLAVMAVVDRSHTGLWHWPYDVGIVHGYSGVRPDALKIMIVTALLGLSMLAWSAWWHPPRLRHVDVRWLSGLGTPVLPLDASLGGSAPRAAAVPEKPNVYQATWGSVGDMFFRRKTVRQQQPPQPAEAMEETRQARSREDGFTQFGSDVVFVGEVTSKGSVIVDGAVQGHVESNRVIVGETGEVLGPVEADDAFVAGQVRGNIKARIVTVDSRGKVNGDVTYEELVLERGAKLSSRCHCVAAAKKPSS